MSVSELTDIPLPTITVTEADRERYLWHTERAIYGIKLIAALSDEQLFAATIRDSKTHAAIKLVIGSNTNSNWVIARAAADLRDRELIDNDEFYRLRDG